MLPRMRTIKEAVAEFKADDPHTAMNESYLRRMIHAKLLPAVMVGNKYLVNMESLEKCLDALPEAQKPLRYGMIRKLPEKADT